MDCAARIPLEPGVVERLDKLIASYESGVSSLPREVLLTAPLPDSRLGVVRLAERIADEASRGVYGKVYAIVGEWGLGKSWAGGRLVEIVKGRGVEARLEHLDNLIDTAYRAMRGRPDQLAARKAMEARLSRPSLPAVVVIDEVEGILRSIRGQATDLDRAAIQAFLDILKSIFDPRLDYGGSLRDRLTLVLLMTREAFNHLRGLLESAGVGGRFLRRSDVVFLQPLARYESIVLARHFIQAVTGRSPKEVFEDERLIEVFHTVSGGVPGTMQEAIVKILRLHARQCEGDCLCRVTSESLIDALSQVTITSESGTQYTPIDREEAEAVISKLLGAREALLLVASTSALAPAEGKQAVPALEGMRAGFTVGVGYRISDLAEWFENARGHLCRSGDELCVSELRAALSNLVHHHPSYGWVLVLPSDPRELVAWLEYYGWTGGPSPREVYEAIRPGQGEPGWVVLRPEFASRLYKSRPPTGLEFIPSPKAREHARELLRRAEESREKMEELVAQGLGIILEYSGVALPAEHSGEYVYRYYWQGYGASTHYEVRLRIIPQMYGPVDACLENPRLKAGIVLVPGMYGYRRECPGLVGVPLEAGVRRRLATIAAGMAAADYYGVPVDHEVLRDTSQRLVRDLGLAEALARAADNLRKSGIIVEPRSKAISLLQASFPAIGKNIERAPLLLADAHYYLVVAGNSQGRATRSEAATAAGLLAELVPYAKGSYWCGVQIPSVSEVDIGKSMDEVADAVEKTLDYLALEGLAAIAGDTVESKVAEDPIAARIIEAYSNRRLTADQALEGFILPSDEAYRREAEARVRARLRALAHLGYAERVGRRGDLYEISRERKITDPPGYMPRGARGLRQKIESAVNLITSVSPRAVPEHLGTLLIYKQKDVKKITPRMLEDVYEYLARLRREWNGTPARREYYESMTRVYNMYVAQLAEKAIDTLTASIEELRSKIRTGRNTANDGLAKLRDMIRNDGPLARLVDRIRSEIEKLLGEAEFLLAAGVEDAMRKGDALVENPRAGHGREVADYLSFRVCEGRSKKPPASLYSPHLYYWLFNLPRVEGEVERRVEEAVELASLAGELAGRITILRLDPDAVAAQILHYAAKHSLTRALDYMVNSLEFEVKRIEAIAERARKLETMLELAKGMLSEASTVYSNAEREVERTQAYVDVEESRSLLSEALRELNRARMLVDQVSKLYENGECSRSETSIEHCTATLERALDAASKASKLAEEALLWAKRRFEERVERAREAVARAVGHVERLKAEAAGVDGIQEQEILAAARKAEEILAEVNPERDPVAAEAAAEAVMRIVDETRRNLVPDEARAVYDILVKLREGEKDLELLLEELEATTGDLVAGLRRLIMMASRHGYRITVRARESRG